MSVLCPSTEMRPEKGKGDTEQIVEIDSYSPGLDCLLHFSVLQHWWSYLNVRWFPSVTENASSVHPSLEQPFFRLLRLMVGTVEKQIPPKCSLLRNRESEVSSGKESVPSFSLSLFFLISKSPSVIISEKDSIVGHFVTMGPGSSESICLALHGAMNLVPSMAKRNVDSLSSSSIRLI